jgi:Tfp pilus assembly protein PilO
MWTNVVILLLIGLFFIAAGWLRQQKEGFDNPYTISQQQQGDIVTLQKQLVKITINDVALSSIQDQVTDLSNKTDTLQKHVPDGQVKKYAPE